MKRAGVGAAIALAIVACKSSSTGPGGGDASAPITDPNDFVASITSSPPCALSCVADCAEANAPWTCPALGDWGSFPHDDAACAWDGKRTPPVVQGACVATDPTGDALTPATHVAPLVLPDGRRLAPAGNEWVFDEPDLRGAFPASALLIPGTKWMIVTDVGDGTESLRVVDVAKLKAGASSSPVVAHVAFDGSHGVSTGMAWRAATSTLYVGGSQTDSQVLAFGLDTATGQLTADDAKAIALPSQTFVQSLALAPDGKTLLVGQVTDGKVLVYDVTAPSAAAASIDLGAPDPFTIRFDPNDASGDTAWATLWEMQNGGAPSTMRIARIDVAKRSVTTIDVPKAPEDVAFLSARWAVVASGLGDALSVVDLAGKSIARTIAVTPSHGLEPTQLAWDATRSRLYATLASHDAVAAYDVDLTASPPTLTPAGALPTGWWPTSVLVDPTDGTVFVVNGKGHGSRDDLKPVNLTYGSDITADCTGSVQAIAAPDPSALAAGQAAVDAQNDVQSVAGYPQVQCNGAPYDFPIPKKIEDGPSTKIKHVIFIVRENKTFDAIFGDMAGRDGNPAFVESPGNMDAIWPNVRAMATQFAHMTNFYEDAELSVQGHTWAVFGRSTDYDERRWPFAGGGRASLGYTASSGVSDSTMPVEGTLFTSVTAAGRTVENGGEFVGSLSIRDFSWPGGTPQSHIADTLPACWLVAHARATCDLKDFTYAWLSNDHTNGLAPDWPNPAVMIATNDEATGMVLEGLSRSPYWPDTLVIVVEDDPQDGSDHVDHHRSIAVFASPWIKRGYASRGHYDMASVHKLLSHVYGTPYRNEEIAKAPLPLDLFTSTPDYTPFTHAPRKWTDISCNPGGTAQAKMAERWDFSRPDEQPGLSRQVNEYMRSLPPR